MYHLKEITMNITSDTATSLGNKLAALELTNEEGALLHTLLTDEDEVTGFVRHDTAKAAAMTADFRPIVKSQITLGYTEVEWTYAKSEDGWIIIES